MANVKEYIRQQNEKRALWTGQDDPEHISKFITTEAIELQEAIQESLLTGDVFSVASEIGDVLYLLYKLCDQIGIDPNQAAEMKVWRNSHKYPDHLMSNGRDYESATKVAKESWKAMGGDYAWSHVYLDYLAHDDIE